ncbi:DUF4340 domain-containing protein [Paracraurococcus ruber]|uniref:DUF4340 domain-containing protein n=1 Tax=Paracraurococcus ruber TaxID=77675 RepID=A0ABS1D1A9_9PROT|nr:DUF4340 domain-containing protein [Paracraurococcus ruber]MBK1660448.1 hypothetical protein [Paracraurococcus ruber]TDG31340.1 DUF4340 domain-containing protein [Paracraurococcus ruber]
MNRRTLVLLGGAAAASVAAAVLLTPKGVEKQAITDAGLAFPGLAARLQGAQRIEVVKPDATLVLARRGEAWVLPAKGGYPARPEKAREMLVGLTELRLVEARTSDPAQHERLGVDDPTRPGSTALLLRVLDGAGAPIAELVLGRRRVRTQGNVPESIYVRRPGEAQAWLAEGRLAVDADPQLWLDRDIANLPQDRVRRVEVRREGEPPLVLARPEEPEARLRIEQPEGAPTPDEMAVDEIARAFEFLTFLDVRTEAEMPGQAVGESRFGLTEGLAIVVRSGLDNGDVWVRLRAEGEGAEVQRLNARWQGWAYQVGVWKLKAFAPRAEELKPREAAAPEPAADDAPAPETPPQAPVAPR